MNGHAMNRILGLALITVTNAASAADFFLISEPVPEAVLTVQYLERLPKNAPRYPTPLGVSSRCYEADQFLILSDNASGNGYELTSVAPEHGGCLKVGNAPRPFTNGASMYLGMAKTRALEILKAPQTSDDATLIYNRQTLVDGQPADEQVWVDVQFSGGQLRRLKVFRSITQ